jgi:hypothetical protein
MRHNAEQVQGIRMIRSHAEDLTIESFRALELTRLVMLDGGG